MRYDVFRSLVLGLRILLVLGITEQSFAQGGQAVRTSTETISEQGGTLPSATTTQPPIPTPVKGETPVLESTGQEVPRVTLNLRDMELGQILKAISRQTGAGFVITKELESRRFTTFLQNVTLREALRGLLEAYGLGHERIGDSNTYVVKALSETKARVVTRIFRLKFTQLAEQTSEKAAQGSAFNIIGGGSGDSASAKKEGDKGDTGGPGLVSVVQNMLSTSGRLQVHPQTSSLIVTDVPDVFPQVEELIEKLDVLIPQVLIEVKIVEVNVSAARNIGLEFGGPKGEIASFAGPSRLINFPTTGNKYRFVPGTAELTGATVGAGTFGGNSGLGIFFGKLSFEQLTAVLRLLETEGKSDFLATPKILTLNNRPAEISITAETVIGIQSASLIAQSGLLTTTAERRKTGITLRVTPQVNDQNLVTLVIEPTVSRPQASEFFPTQFVDPQTRSLRTSVRVKDGETVLIGGLLSDEKRKTVRRVPLLWRIPILGWLFTSHDATTIKRELMIFITPRVIR